MKKFAALFDVHWGYENRGGHKVPLHDLKAIRATLKFLKDFQPDTIILGGDMLDCSAVSHHTKRKGMQREGLRLLQDARECRQHLISPLEGLTSDLTYIVGNHEKWLSDLVDEEPGLEGIVDICSILQLKKWDIVPQGKGKYLGKLYFVHGDQIPSILGKTQRAVTDYERSIRFGHFHTYQAFTKVAAADCQAKTGVSVPCLCRGDANYMEGKASWTCQGFNWGYVFPNGHFSDYITIITNGRFAALGKEYQG